MSADDNYSIGFGTVGDDDFDQVDAPSAPAPVSGLSAPPQTRSSTVSDNSLPSFLNNSPVKAPSFLGASSNSAPVNNPKVDTREEIQASNTISKIDVPPQVIEEKPETPKDESYDYLSTLYPDISFSDESNPLAQADPLDPVSETFAEPDNSFMQPIGEYKAPNNPVVENSFAPEKVNEVVNNEKTAADYSINNFETQQTADITNFYSAPQNQMQYNPQAQQELSGYMDEYRNAKGGSIFGFLFKFVRFLFIFLIIVGFFGGIIGGYLYYKPMYLMEKSNMNIINDLSQIKIDLNNLSIAAVDLYTKIEKGKEDSAEMFVKDGDIFWFEVSSDAREVESFAQTITDDLNAYKISYRGQGIPDFENDVDSILSYVKAVEEYSQIHILTSQVILNTQKELYNIHQRFTQNDLNTSKELIDNLISYSTQSKNDFSNRLYSQEVIQSYDLLSYYFDYVDNNLRLLRGLKESLGNPTAANNYLTDLGKDFAEVERIEAERLYYGSFTKNQYVVNKDKIIENLDNQISNSIKIEMPKIIYDLFKTVEDEFGLI